MPLVFVAIGLIILGWFAGLVVNYVADTLPYTRSLRQPSCSACGKPLPWVDYFLFKHQVCGNKRGLRVWLVQAVSVGLILRLGLVPEMAEPAGFFGGLVLLIFFGVVVIIDFEHRLILHPVSLAGAVVCGLIGVLRRGWVDTLIGGAVAFAFMFVVYWLAEVFIRWVRKKRGLESDEVAMGFGDVTLSGVLGLLLGWPGIIGGLMLAFLLGGLGSLIVIGVTVVRRRFQAFNTYIPYGPYLVLAAALLFFK